MVIMLRKICSYLCLLVLLSVTCFSAIAEEAKTINWVDLLPQADFDALSNPPEYINEIDDGSFEDQISNQLQQALTLSADDAYQQALISTAVVPEMDGQHIRLPGFIVPLDFNGEQRTTHFFIVPYFGACIHLPPPPPNQIIYGEYPGGVEIADIYNAYWVTGTLHTTLTKNDTATSAYSLTVTGIEIYEDDGEY